jgi:hypothetical protein
MVSWKFQDRIFPSGELRSLPAPTVPRFVQISGPGRDEQTRMGCSSDGEIKV